LGVDEVISMEEAVQEIHATMLAARQARQDPDFIIVVRTDALRTQGYAK